MNTREELLKIYDFDKYSRQPISYYYCQAGFITGMTKRIIVWTTSDFIEGYMEIKSKTGNKKETYVLNKVGCNQWGRIEWVCDFTLFNNSGDYFICAVFEKNFGPVHEIMIRDDMNIRLLEKAAKHLFLKRCGIFCHIHDGWVYSHEQEDFGRPVKMIDASGGSHEAHDDNKWLVFMWNVIEALLNTYEYVPNNWTGVNSSLPYLLEEAKWQIDFLVKMQKVDGSFYYGVFEYHPVKYEKNLSPGLPIPSGNIGGWIYSVHDQETEYDDLHEDKRLVLDLWGENEACKLMGRIFGTSPSTPEKYFALFAYNMLRFARLYAKFDPEYSKNLRERALKTLEYLKNAVPKGYQYLDYHSALSMCYLELSLSPYRSKDEKWDELSRKHLLLVLDQARPDGLCNAHPGTDRPLELFPEDEPDQLPFFNGVFWYMFGVIRYLEVYNNDEVAIRCQKLLKDLCNLLSGICKNSVWNHVGQISVKGSPKLLDDFLLRTNDAREPGGSSPINATIAAILAAGTRLTDGYYLNESLSNLEWILGANPRFASFMVDVGIRNIGNHKGLAGIYVDEKPENHAAFYRHRRDVRYGITTGMCLDSKYWPLFWPKSGDIEGQIYDSNNAESSIAITGWFLLAQSEFYKAANARL